MVTNAYFTTFYYLISVPFHHCLFCMTRSSVSFCIDMLKMNIDGPTVIQKPPYIHDDRMALAFQAFKRLNCPLFYLCVLRTALTAIQCLAPSSVSVLAFTIVLCKYGIQYPYGVVYPVFYVFDLPRRCRSPSITPQWDKVPSNRGGAHTEYCLINMTNSSSLT